MKYLSEYRDGSVARGLIARIRKLATRRWVLMEVCGGQTHTIVRQGLDQLLGDSVEMIHGPGCPVCVSFPVVGSIRKTTIESLFWLPATRNVPLGSMLNARGVLPPVGTCCTVVSCPLDGSTAKTTRLS